HVPVAPTLPAGRGLPGRALPARPEEAIPLRGGQALNGSLARGPTSWYTTPHESLCRDGGSTGLALVPPRGGYPERLALARREGRFDARDDGRPAPPHRRGCRSDPGGPERRQDPEPPGHPGSDPLASWNDPAKDGSASTTRPGAPRMRQAGLKSALDRPLYL